MKKIKLSVLVILLVMTVFALTACGKKDYAGNSTSGANSPTTTQGVTTTGETTGAMNDTTNGANSNTGESSTGVIGGMVNDVEKGVNDMMDGTDGSTNAADETKR